MKIKFKASQSDNIFKESDVFVNKSEHGGYAICSQDGAKTTHFHSKSDLKQIFVTELPFYVGELISCFHFSDAPYEELDFVVLIEIDNGACYDFSYLFKITKEIFTSNLGKKSVIFHVRFEEDYPFGTGCGFFEEYQYAVISGFTSLFYGSNPLLILHKFQIMLSNIERLFSSADSPTNDIF